MPHQKGYSLLELLITLSMSSILITTGLPSLLSLIEHFQSKADLHKLVIAIQLTRQQAVTHTQTTSLCPHHSNNECSTDWTRGIMVFSDVNSNGDREVDEPVIRLFSEFSGSLRWISFGSNNYLRYTANGFTLNQNGSFHYCSKRTENQYRLTINRTGRSYIQKNASC